MKKTAFIIIALLLAFGCSDEKHEVRKEDNPLFSTSRAISLNQLGETINLEKIGIYNPTKVIKKSAALAALSDICIQKTQLILFNIAGDSVISFQCNLIFICLKLRKIVQHDIFDL